MQWCAPLLTAVVVQVLDRYIDPALCDWIVDLALVDPAQHEPWIREALQGGADSEWFVFWRSPFMQKDASPSALFRALYIPMLSDSRVRWAEYLVLRRRRRQAPPSKPATAASASPVTEDVEWNSDRSASVSEDL